MPNKYKMPESKPTLVQEPAAAYGMAVAQTVFSSKWDPNVPFHGTQEEWWEHFHRIEEGEFMTIEEADKEFEIWKKEYLASRI